MLQECKWIYAYNEYDVLEKNLKEKLWKTILLRKNNSNFGLKLLSVLKLYDTIAIVV